jgi:hypothetical protein
MDQGFAADRTDENVRLSADDYFSLAYSDLAANKDGDEASQEKRSMLGHPPT